MNTPAKSDKKIALVTGGNKGIGFEICRQLAQKGCLVLLAARDRAKGTEAAGRLRAEGLEVQFIKLDVTSETDIDAAISHIRSEFGRLDILVNNAGVFLDPDSSVATEDERSAFKAKLSTIQATLEVNTFGPFLLCQKLIPLMIKSGYGRVVNVSSGMGQLSEMNGGVPAYRLSKVALNGVTRIFADEAQGKGVLVNSACPGWVKTDMGGEGADRTVAEGADTIVWLATLPNDGPTGGFFRDRERLEW